MEKDRKIIRGLGFALIILGLLGLGNVAFMVFSGFSLGAIIFSASVGLVTLFAAYRALKD